MISDSTYKLIDLVAKTAAVVIGAAWTLMNYRRSRTHQLRCEIQVKGTCEPRRGGGLLHLQASLKNVGLSKFELVGEGCALVVCRRRYKPKGTTLTSEVVGAVDVFDSHRWIEPGEQVYDEAVLCVGLDEEDSALSVEMSVTGMVRGRVLQRWREQLLFSVRGRLAMALLLAASAGVAYAGLHLRSGWLLAGLLIPAAYVAFALLLLTRGTAQYSEWSSRCVVKIPDDAASRILWSGGST